MRHLGLIRGATRRTSTTVQATERTWIRARHNGLLRLRTKLGRWVVEDEPIGVISDTCGNDSHTVIAPAAGLVIGHTHHPMVHPGDAIVPLATNVVAGGVNG